MTAKHDPKLADRLLRAQVHSLLAFLGEPDTTIETIEIHAGADDVEFLIRVRTPAPDATPNPPVPAPTPDAAKFSAVGRLRTESELLTDDGHLIFFSMRPGFDFQKPYVGQRVRAHFVQEPSLLWDGATRVFLDAIQTLPPSRDD